MKTPRSIKKNSPRKPRNSKRQARPVRRVPAVALALPIILGAQILKTEAASYTWIGNTPGTSDWNAAGNWNGAVYSGAGSTTDTLTFFADTTTALASGNNLITTNVPTSLTFNVLTLNGRGANTTAATNITIGSSASTWTLAGASPTVNLLGVSGTQALNYTVAPNLVLSAPTTFQGAGSAGFTFTGNISGVGDFIKAGSSSLTLSGTNTYGGVTTINGGTVDFTKTYCLYGGTSASWTATNITVGSGGTAIFNVGGTGEFTTGNVSTLLTNLLAVNNNGLKSGAAIGFNTASTITIADTITNSVGPGGGSISLSKLGTGTLTLSGNNSFTGGINVSAGVLVLKNSYAAGTGTISFGGQKLWFDNSGTGQNILFTNTVLANGSTWENIAGDNKVTANLSINSGASSNYFIVDAGTIEFSGNYGAGTTGRNVYPQGAGNGLFSGNLTFGSNNISKGGSGTWTLTGANSYSGSTTVGAGTLVARSSNALGSSPVTVSANANLSYLAASDTNLNLASTLAITGGASTAIGGSIGASATSAQINVAGAATTTAAAVKVNVFGINGVAPLAGTNTYTLVHSATNTSTLNNATYSLGTVYNNTNFTVGALSKSATDLQVAITAATAVTSAFWKGGLTGGTNIWAASNGSTQSNWTTASGGADQPLVPGAGADVTISNSPVTTAPTATFLGADMAIKSLTIADTTNGLGLGNDFFTLTISPTDSSAGITLNSSVPASTINARVKLGAAQTWTNNSANALTVSGIVSGTGSLVKSGTGTIILSGWNTYTGDTSLNQGTLKLSSPIAAQSSTVIMNGGALVFDQSVIGNAFTLGGLAASSSGGSYDIALQNNAASPAAVALTVGGNNASTTYAGSLSGAGSLTKTGTGTLILTGTNTFTGANTLSGGMLSISSELGASNTPITFNGGGLQVTGTAVSGFGSHPVTYNASKTVTLDINDANNNFNAGSSPFFSTDVLTKLGAGTLTLGAATNALTTLNLNANSTVDIGSGTLTIGNAGGATIATTAGGTINATGGGALVLTQASGSNGADVGTAGGTTLTINARITGANVFEVYQASGGTVVLNGTNDYSGNTLVSSGTLQVSNIGNQGSTTSNLGQGTTLSIGSTTNLTGLRYTGTGETTNRILTLASTTANTTIDQSGTSGLLKFTSDVVVSANGAKTLILQGAGAGEIAGIIPNSGSGATSLTGSGTGIWTLSGSNSYTGATTVSAGTLKNGSANTFTSKGTLVLSGTSTFDLNGYNAGFTDVPSSVATATIIDNGATSGTSTLAIGAESSTISALVKDGATRKLAVSIANNNNAAASFTASSANTFSGGLFLLNSANGTRLRINSAPVTTGSAGAIVSSPFGTGPIVIGQAATDKAGIMLDTVNNIAIANDLVFNTALGTDIVGLRVDTTGNVLSGKITANLANATFAAGSASTGSVALNGQVTGSQGLSLSASTSKLLTVTLNNAGAANNYAGDTTVGYTGNTNNVLVLGRADQIPNGAGKGNVNVIGTLNLGGFNETINGLNGSGTVDGISGSPALTVGDGNATGNTFSGVLKNTAGALALTKIGSGTQTLSGSNTYSGATTVSAGTLNLSNQFAAQGSTVTMNGGTLTFDQLVGGNAFTVGGLAGSSSGAGYDIALQNNAGTPAAVALTVGGSTANTTYAGVLSGSGSLTKVGSNMLTLTGTNTYSGVTSINAGTLSIGSTSALPGWNTADRWAISSGATLAVSNNVLDADVATLTQTGTNLRAGSALGFDTSAGNRSFGNLLADGAAGSLGLTKTGSNTLTLTAANTYTGVTTLSAGTVNLGVAEVAGASGPLGNSAAANPGSIVLNGGILQSSALNNNDYSGRFSTAANQAYNIDTNGQDVTWATPLSSSGGSLTKLGAGTLTLSASNSFTGTTTLAAGVLVAANAAALGGGNITFTGGTLKFTSASASQNWEPLFKNSTSPIVLDTNGQSITLSSGADSSNTGGLTQLGGGFIDLKSGSFTGPFTITAGTVINRTNAGGSMILGGTSYVLVFQTASYSHPISVAPDATGVEIANYSDYSPTISSSIYLPASQSIYLHNTNAHSSYPNTNMQFAGVISGAGSVSVSGGVYAGMVTLTGSNTYSGGTTYYGGGYLRIGVDSVGSVGSITSGAFGTGTLTLQGGTLVSSGTMDRSILNPVAFAGNVALGDASAAPGPYDGQLTFLAGIDLGSAVRTITINSPVEFDGSVGGSGGITKAGGSTLILTGSNTYTGATTVTAGILQLGDGTSGHDPVLATSGIVNSSQLRFDYCNDQTVGTPLSGLGTVWQQGNNTLTLTGSNSTGPVSILSGTLQLGDGTAGNDGSLSAPSIINNSSLVYNVGATFSGTSPISGTGSVMKTGPGMLTLSGNNSFSGGLTLNSGTLAIGNASALGSGTLTIANASTVQSNGSIVTSNPVAANADFAIGGTSALTLGTVTVNSDRNITNNNTSATTTIGGIAGGSSALAFSGDGNTSVGVTAAGSVNKTGAGILTLTGSNTISGGVTLNAGTLVIGNASALGSGTLTIANPSTVQSNGTIVTTNAVAANADFSIGGSAALTLGNVSLNSNRIISNNNTAATTTFGNITGGTNSLTFAGSGGESVGVVTAALLTKTGAGWLSVSSSPSVSALIIKEGTLYTNNSLGNVGSITLGDSTGVSTVPTFLIGSAGYVCNRTINVVGANQINTIRDAGSSQTYSGPINLLGASVVLNDLTYGNPYFTGGISGTGNVTFACTHPSNAGGSINVSSGGINISGTIFNASTIGSPVSLNSVISGPTSVTQNPTSAASIMTLSGSNTFTGGVTLTKGTLRINNASALGSGAFTINGGTIDSSSASPITNSNNNAIDIGSDFTFAGTQSVNLGAGTVTLDGAGSRIITVAANTLTMGGSIGNGTATNLTKSGSGTLVLSGSSSYNGGTQINGGTLVVGNANALGAGDLTVNSGTLNLNGNHLGVGALSGSGGLITSAVSGTSTLSTTVASGTSAYAGAIADGAGSVTLSKGGTGTLVLSGSLSMAGLNVDSGVVELVQSGRIGALTVSGSGGVAFSANGVNSAKVLDTSSFSIAPGGTLDLWDNAMIVRDQTGGINQGANLATVQGLVNTAFDNGNWDKPGITSSSVVADLGAYSVLTVMVYDNTVLGIDSFEGINGLLTDNGGNQVMLKATYLGDFDGNGIVNSADYGWLDFYYGYGLTVGDLNGDGQVNSADYNGIDYGYGYQAYGVLAGGAAPAASAALAAAPAPSEAVPEPSTLGISMLGIAALFGIRRKGGRRIHGV